MNTSPFVGVDSVSTAHGLTDAASGVLRRKWEWLVLAGILVGGGALRLVAASGLPLWYDESITFMDASGSWGHLFRWEHNFFAAPGIELLAKLSLTVFGVSELALRLPAVVFGITNLALVYVLARRATDAIAALSCAALVAISPVMVATDAYSRCYSTWLFCVLCMLLSLTSERRLMRVEHLPLSKVLVNWCGLAVLVVLGFWVHMLNAYVALAVFVALAARYFQARRAGSATNVQKIGFGVALSCCAGPWWGSADRDARDRLHSGLRLLKDVRPVRGLQQHQRCDAARGIPRTACDVEQRRLLMPFLMADELRQRLAIVSRILHGVQQHPAWQAQDAAPRPPRRQGQAMGVISTQQHCSTVLRPAHRAALPRKSAPPQPPSPCANPHRSQSDDTSECVSRRSGRSQRREGHARLGPQAALERAPHGLAHPMLLQVLHHRWLRSVPRRRTAGRVVAGFFRAAEGDGEEGEGGLGALGAEQAHGER